MSGAKGRGIAVGRQRSPAQPGVVYRAVVLVAAVVVAVAMRISVTMRVGMVMPARLGVAPVGMAMFPGLVRVQEQPWTTGAERREQREEGDRDMGA